MKVKAENKDAIKAVVGKAGYSIAELSEVLNQLKEIPGSKGVASKLEKMLKKLSEWHQKNA